MNAIKIHNAKKQNHESVTVWGDGSPTRDFLFVTDAARGIVLAGKKYDKPEPLNLGSEQEISFDEGLEKTVQWFEENHSLFIKT